MDDSELHYLTFSPDDIWTEMQKAYTEAGGDPLYPGDEKEMLLRSVQAIIVQAFAGIDNALRMQTLRYAVGEYLDTYGEMRNCARIQAIAAAATVTITTNATGRSGILNAGTAMTADGRKYYLLDEDVTLTGYAQTLTATIRAAEPGSAGNGLQAGTSMFLSVDDPSVSSIIVTAGASGGEDREDDETYRERIRAYGLISVTTGPAHQYEARAKAVSASIIDAKAINGGAGAVLIYLLLTSGASEEQVVNAVYAALSADDVRPMTDQVSVHIAGVIEYTLKVGYELDSGVSVTALQEAVAEYKSWQDLTIGRAFNPDRLLALLYQAGATRIVWKPGSVFGDDGEIEYTEISENVHVSGTITLEAL